MNDEIENLRRYAKTGSEDAFASVVDGCLPLVYGAAMRRLGGDAHRARDVAQLVFIALARNASSLARRPDLCGWLFTTTHFLAAKTLRTEQRRAKREAQAVTMNHGESEFMKGEAELSKVLDDVTLELKQLDQQVILLRFYRGMRWADVGGRLGLSDNAAQKRVDRALEALREKLRRRGVTSTAAAVALAMQAHGATSVPAGMAANITTVALTGSAGVGALAWSGSFFMITTKIQLSIVAAVTLAAVAGFGWQFRQNGRLQEAAELRVNVARSEAALMWREKLAAQVKRTAEAEADLGNLLRVVDETSRTNRPGLKSRTGLASEAIARAGKLKSEGKVQEALDELLLCYRDLRGEPTWSYDFVSLFFQMKQLGLSFPSVRAAFLDLRENALRDYAANPQKVQLACEAALLSLHLGEGDRALALFDKLPEGDPGRRSIGIFAQQEFLKRQRYEDAASVKPFGAMLNELDRGAQTLVTNPAFGPDLYRASLVESTATNIEILTGAKKLADARLLTERLLAFDDTDATRATIKRHIERIPRH